MFNSYLNLFKGTEKKTVCPCSKGSVGKNIIIELRKGVNIHGRKKNSPILKSEIYKEINLIFCEIRVTTLNLQKMKKKNHKFAR